MRQVEVTIDTDDPITITSSANGINLSSFGEQDITCGSLDINSNGIITIDSVSSMTLASGADVLLSSAAGNNFLITGGLDFDFEASNDIIMVAGADVDVRAETGDVNFTATDIIFETVGTSNGLIHFIASESITFDSTVDINFNTTTGEIYLNAKTEMNNDFLIRQSTYPPSSNVALGYKGTTTLNANALAATMAQEKNWSLPQKGVWLIHATITLAAVSGATINYFEAVISLTSASATEASAGLSYLQEQDEMSGVTGKRLTISLSGVVSVTAATTLYLNARGQAASGGAPTIAAAISWTRLG
jgi:hypothetical protein